MTNPQGDALDRLAEEGFHVYAAILKRFEAVDERLKQLATISGVSELAARVATLETRGQPAYVPPVQGAGVAGYVTTNWVTEQRALIAEARIKELEDHLRKVLLLYKVGITSDGWVAYVRRTAELLGEKA